MNSRDALKYFNSGNCIALSMCVQKYLKQTFNIESFLIPATIKKYQHTDYLDISHVALAIPVNKNEYFIADSAFYFLNPIKINIKNLQNASNQIVFSKNIYQFEPFSKIENYSSIQKIKYVNKKFNQIRLYNKFQSIPTNTYYTECYYTDDVNDKWNYFLIEVLNPDEAISTFFINIRNKPFITSCIMDHNGVCKIQYYIKFSESNFFVEKYAKNGSYYTLNLDELDPLFLQEIEMNLNHFLKMNFKITLIFIHQ